ncbi:MULTISPECIES: hypothetical protein [unclassified Methanoregula]|uniref:hypothetical protein n=1 Tax=unclassified Methanoregula TaxID=2649730 RepID=UPI0009D2D7E5|nr:MULTISPECIES: hypothetical protein [unclassified Methanoregula]OPX64870.1 MAG: hypothetical protein A4E33_00608 [Methanoregula sp. PtaB.Bin085]OPY32922.1 MAG: hypothetical protein A4E34_02299 [Methanoregula sp. PtaU1.Bin006]
MPGHQNNVLIGGLAGVLVLIAAILAVNAVIPPPDHSAGPVPGVSGQDTRGNVILGLAILGILSTFGLIAYYYTNISFGAGK